MCGRFTLASPAERIRTHFRLASPPDLEPRYNIAPGQDIIAVAVSPDRERKLSLLRWGFVPHWAKDPKSGYRMINARAETVADKPAFRRSFKMRRCLVPADGFYEWKAEPQGKQPYWIARDDGDVFAIAALWDHWRSEDGTVINSVVLITAEAAGPVAEIHDRCPVILNPADYDQWLEPENSDPAQLKRLLSVDPGYPWHRIPVSRRVNNTDNDDRDLLEPVTDHA